MGMPHVVGEGKFKLPSPGTIVRDSSDGRYDTRPLDLMDQIYGQECANGLSTGSLKFI